MHSQTTVVQPTNDVLHSIKNKSKTNNAYSAVVVCGYQAWDSQLRSENIQNRKRQLMNNIQIRLRAAAKSFE